MSQHNTENQQIGYDSGEAVCYLKDILGNFVACDFAGNVIRLNSKQHSVFFDVFGENKQTGKMIVDSEFKDYFVIIEKA